MLSTFQMSFDNFDNSLMECQVLSVNESVFVQVFIGNFIVNLSIQGKFVRGIQKQQIGQTFLKKCNFILHLKLFSQQEMSDYTISGNGNGTQPPKTFTPYIPITKSFQPYTPSTIPVNAPPNLIKTDSKNDETKVNKYNNNPISSQTSSSSGLATKTQSSSFKTIPTFLQNRNVIMKGSMIATEGQAAVKQVKIQNPQSQVGSTQYNSHQYLKKSSRQAEMIDMKYSAIQPGQQVPKNSFVPTFLQRQKKPAYLNGLERPQSSKQAPNSKNQPQSLTSSYGNLKKFRQEKIQQNNSNNLEVKDPTAEWIKKSWSKKKQKTLSINDFERVRELGSGKYGKVFLARQKHTNFICALKILQKSLIKQQQITEQIIRQLKIQSFLNHTNLIKMYGFFDDATNIYLIMESATGGQLFKQLKKHQSMPEVKVAAIMRQVCQAVNQLHSNRIIHRDIKPENIVIHDNVIKLCDFGWSVYCDSNLRTTFCGTPLYVGPEILKGKEYDEKIDIWSLGVMMYEMLVGENPFKIVKEEDLVKIIKDDIKIPSYVEISKEGRDFLFSCLQKNPDNRLCIRQLLNHEFFKKYPDKNDKKLGI